MPMRPEHLCGGREGICRRGKHATRSSNARLCVMDRGLSRQERSHHGLLLQQARHHVAVRFHPDELDRANDDAGCDGQLLSHMRHDWPAGRPTRHRSADAGWRLTWCWRGDVVEDVSRSGQQRERLVVDVEPQGLVGLAALSKLLRNT